MIHTVHQCVHCVTSHDLGIVLSGFVLAISKVLPENTRATVLRDVALEMSRLSADHCDVLTEVADMLLQITTAGLH